MMRICRNSVDATRRGSDRLRSIMILFAILVMIQNIASAFAPLSNVVGRKSRIQSWSLLQGTKSGGKLIETPQQYSDWVMDRERSRLVLVFWTAPWCGPCRLSIPVVKDVVKQFSGRIDAMEVCTDDLPEVAADAGVVSIPTIQLYFKGQIKDTIIGCVAKTVLCNAVEKVLDEVGSSSKSEVKRAKDEET